MALLPALSSCVCNELVSGQLVPEKGGCISLSSAALPCALLGAWCLRKLDFTDSQGKNSPDYTEEVYVCVVC